MPRRRTSPVVQIVMLPNPWLIHSRPERPQVNFDISDTLVEHMDTLTCDIGTSRQSCKGTFSPR